MLPPLLPPSGNDKNKFRRYHRIVLFLVRKSQISNSTLFLMHTSLKLYNACKLIYSLVLICFKEVEQNILISPNSGKMHCDVTPFPFVARLGSNYLSALSIAYLDDNLFPNLSRRLLKLNRRQLHREKKMYAVLLISYCTISRYSLGYPIIFLRILTNVKLSPFLCLLFTPRELATRSRARGRAAVATWQ